MSKDKQADPIVEVEQFGKLPDGTAVLSYTLKNGLGAELQVLEYGGTVRRFTVPGPDGQPRNVIVGPDTLEGWFKEPYYGQLVARRHPLRPPRRRGRLQLPRLEGEVLLQGDREPRSRVGARQGLLHRKRRLPAPLP